MKKHAIALALAALSCTAMAGWEPISDNSESVGYYDPSTLVRTGDEVTVSELNDFKRVATTVSDALFRSTTTQRAYDCAGARTRIITLQPFEGQMGAGRALNPMNVDGDWQDIVVGTPRADAYNLMCK
jgi:hypothetical protein